MKIFHILNVREELFHIFEVRYNKGCWRKTQTFYRFGIEYKTKNDKRVPRFTYTPKKGKNAGKRVGRKFRNVFISSQKKFNQVRVDKQIVFKLRRSGMKTVNLKTFINKNVFEKVSPLLRYINGIRQWAHSQDLHVGGFPLMPFKKILQKNVRGRPPENIDIGDEQNEEEGEYVEVEFGKGYFSLRDKFFKKYGLGQVWEGFRGKTKETIKLFFAMWGHSAWREYKGERPRFWVQSRFVDIEDLDLNELGVKRLETKQGRQVLSDFLFDNRKFYENSPSGEIERGPLGVVGWVYVE